MTLKIYYGKSAPATAVGKNQCRLLQFLFDAPGPRTYKKNCRATKKAVEGLVKRGVAIHHQEFSMVEFKS
jgi:hypothetical protein